MDEKLDKKLMERFGFLYRDRSKTKTKSCMYWGFSCGSGWFKILWDLSEDIDKILSTLPKDRRELFNVKQVKEKFGGLRFYCSSPPEVFDEIQGLVRKAENNSYKVCERCGKPGKVRTDGWASTRCDACFKKK